MNNQRSAMTICILLMFAGVFLWLLTGFTLAGAALPAINAIDAGSALALRARYGEIGRAHV